MKINAEQLQRLIARLDAIQAFNRDFGKSWTESCKNLKADERELEARLERVELGQAVLCGRLEGLKEENDVRFRGIGNHLDKLSLQVAVLDQRCHEIQGALLHEQFKASTHLEKAANFWMIEHRKAYCEGWAASIKHFKANGRKRTCPKSKKRKK